MACIWPGRHGMRRWMMIGLIGLAACGDGQARPPRERAAAPVPPPPPALPPSWNEAEVRAAFGRARPLGAREVAELRQDVNAEQVATARRLGIRAGGEAAIDGLTRRGRLVALGDSTAYWVLRDMDHSVPFVTPDTRAMLVELGRRFHARLDSLGLPRYRMKVTSALRTDETQAELRRTNSYASRTTSAHEFGTTVDVSHERFAVPADRVEGETEMLETVGKEHAKVLQAELGRAIAGLRDERALHVMMENMQPVYHMTIARRFRS